MQCGLAKRFFKRRREEEEQAVSCQVLPSPVSLPSSGAAGNADRGLTGNMRVCCFSSITRKIPLSLVKNYERTSDKCPQEAVIFQTRSGRSICANPGQAWVQKYIEYLDQTSK
uniref:C-C motif chemokine n=1 Tax=Bos mutus grunniens TaxID=30521 RepID=A0A8B9YMG2_BOSMU